MTKTGDGMGREHRARAVLAQLAGYRLALCCVMGLSILEALFAALSITALIPVAGAFVQSGADEATHGTPWPLGELNSLAGDDPISVLMILAALLAAKVAATLARVVLMAQIKRRLWRRWAHRLVERFLHMPYRRWLRQDSGELINLASNEMNRAMSVISSSVTLVTQALSIVLLFTSLVVVDWRVSLVAVAGGSILYFGGLRRINRASRRYGTVAVGLARAVVGLVAETMRAVRDIRLLSAEGRRLDDVDEVVARSTNNDFRVTLLHAIPTNSVDLLLALLIVAAALAALAAGDGGPNATFLPLLLFFLVALFRLAGYAASVATLYVKLANRYPSLVAVMRALSVDDAERRVEAEAGAVPGRAEVEAWRPTEGFSLRDLTFSYNGRPVLDKLSLELPLGSLTYLFGPSGSGKSSLADIVARLHDASPGTLLLDGRDSNEVPLSAWRHLVGYVSQDPVLFSGTLYGNLVLGRGDIARADVAAALDVVGMGDFVRELDDGLDTPLVESGRNLSGGQKCRIAIARALLRNPSLLILDESTNGLEPALEAAILARLRERRGLTVLVISHRRDNADAADQIATIEGGAIRMERRFSARGCTAP